MHKAGQYIIDSLTAATGGTVMSNIPEVQNSHNSTLLVILASVFAPIIKDLGHALIAKVKRKKATK